MRVTIEIELDARHAEEIAAAVRRLARMERRRPPRDTSDALRGHQLLALVRSWARMTNDHPGE